MGCQPTLSIVYLTSRSKSSEVPFVGMTNSAVTLFFIDGLLDRFEEVSHFLGDLDLRPWNQILLLVL